MTTAIERTFGCWLLGRGWRRRGWFLGEGGTSRYDQQRGKGQNAEAQGQSDHDSLLLLCDKRTQVRITNSYPEGHGHVNGIRLDSARRRNRIFGSAQKRGACHGRHIDDA